METSLTFFGGAGTVTGSKTLVQHKDHAYLVDCGLFQGLKELRLKNWDDFPVDVRKINAVILTHAHLDHCGALPLLVRAGYSGPIYMTEPTRALAEIILRDSARIQEEDARLANEYKYSKHHPAKPLYTEEDALRAISHFVVVPDAVWQELPSGAKYRLGRNGHIMGSVYVEMDLSGKRVVFSGDLGRDEPLLLDPAAIPEKADVLVLESTYGDRLHEMTDPEIELKKHVSETVDKGGTVLIPCFAVSRAQEVMYYLSVLRKKKKLPHVPVYLDSPMAIRVMEVMKEMSSWHKLSDAECAEVCGSAILVENFRDTAKIAEDNRSKIVIAGSGMVTGGRILHYLETYLADPRSLVLLTGYQALGTRGRHLVDGAREIKLHGRYFTVACSIQMLDGLSAHADQNELVSWIKKIPQKPSQIILNHGEPAALDAFRVCLNDRIGTRIVIAALNEKIIL